MADKKSKMAVIKTKPTAENVEAFINAIADEQKRADSFVLMKMMQEASGEEPVLWGSSIIGYGNKRYKSPTSGREVDWFIIGFAPRKANLTVYLVAGLKEHEAAFQKLGKHKLGGGCLYINKLADIDVAVLKGIVKASYKKGLTK